MFYPLVFPRDTHLAQVAAGPEPPSLFYLGDTHVPYARWRPRQINRGGVPLVTAIVTARNPRYDKSRTTDTEFYPQWGLIADLVRQLVNPELPTSA